MIIDETVVPLYALMEELRALRRQAPIVSAARALVPLLVIGWDEYDEDADQAAGRKACDDLIDAVRFVDAAIAKDSDGK